MGFTKKWKKIAVLGLGLTLVFGQVSYADTAVVQAGSSQVVSTAANIKQPEIAAQGACLMDAATGQVLFGKNQDQQFYPASITKVMTALLVLERCNLSDVVTFSSTATTNLESGAVALGVSVGDQLTVEQSLYGLLLKSANEIGNGLAEHVSGSISAFADLMNEKAASLGCRNTTFANPHGLNNSNHKTTAYDMCLILRAAVQNETFRKIDTTLTYNFPALKNAGARTITMGHKMMYPSDSRYYPGIIGGKTGYTSLAGNTLVTAVERDGVRLIAVVLKSSGTHYTDTKAMLDYGFENYTALTGRSSSSASSSVSGGSSVVSAGSSSGAAADTGSSTSSTIVSGAAQTVTGPGASAAETAASGTVTAGETSTAASAGSESADAAGSTSNGTAAEDAASQTQNSGSSEQTSASTESAVLTAPPQGSQSGIGDRLSTVLVPLYK